MVNCLAKHKLIRLQNYNFFMIYASRLLFFFKKPCIYHFFIVILHANCNLGYYGKENKTLFRQ